jgi:hypothetical protein
MFILLDVQGKTFGPQVTINVHRIESIHPAVSNPSKCTTIKLTTGDITVDHAFGDVLEVIENVTGIGIQTPIDVPDDCKAALKQLKR